MLTRGADKSAVIAASGRQRPLPEEQVLEDGATA